MATIIVFYLGLGVLLTFAGLPLWRGLVPPNRWYGVRLTQTLNDPPTWYAANARFGRILAIVGIGLSIAAGSALAARWTTPGAAFVLAAVVVIGVLWASLAAVATARRVT